MNCEGRLYCFRKNLMKPSLHFSSCSLLLEDLPSDLITRILNDLRIIICLRKPEITAERISVRNAIEKLMEHGIHCLSCSYTHGVIDL